MLEAGIQRVDPQPGMQTDTGMHPDHQGGDGLPDADLGGGDPQDTKGDKIIGLEGRGFGQHPG